MAENNDTPVEVEEPEETEEIQERTFSQDDIDRIVSERLKKERAKFSDYKDLKTKAEKLDQLEIERLSETEKLVKERDELKSQNERILQEARQTRIQSRIVSIASGMNFHNPEDVYRLVDTSSIEFDDNGNPTGIEETIKNLAERSPYLIKAQTPSTASFNPAGDSMPAEETDEQRRLRIYGGQAKRFFDPKYASKKGGGVIFKKE